MNESTFDPLLLRKITQWHQEVVIYTDNQDSSPVRAANVYAHNETPPRRSARVNALREISQNKAGRKRKNSMDAHRDHAVDGEEESSHPAKRGPGRPRGSTSQKRTAHGRAQSTKVPGQATVIFPNDSASDLRPPSPVKKERGIKTIDQEVSDAAITMEYLKCCNPSVMVFDMQEAISAGTQFPESISRLYRKLYSVPKGLIPRGLKDEYVAEANTRNKSRSPLENSDFLPADKMKYPLARLAELKAKVEIVRVKARRNELRRAIERQWGAIAHELFCEAERFVEGVEVLNIENCSIEPVEMRPIRPNGQIFTDYDVEGQSLVTKSSVDTNGELKSMGKMIDWMLGLVLKSDEHALLQRAYRNLRDHKARAISQSLSYIKDCPAICDIEIKKEQDPRDPLVQSAIWASAALKKKKSFEWDTTLPMPAILIDGHEWRWCLFFAGPPKEDILYYAGPFVFGHTRDRDGIWAILYRLQVLVEWGVTDYRTWFDKTILGWARETSKQGQAGGAEQGSWEKSVPGIGGK
ncbi:uncharacterized protein KY384_000023 [Bacidia gigantensis]|uniref:uncharacterized protein n=1 Tax=Bacidia gigantensis TaxID=2732470 RepID=UPI001D038174|nr:uncharacterized protein KY384_000023 [Bacidia gigantensis]KAG8526430.1 hypothetical protein KY384_000023 [Bacidia gigantensis]